MPAAGMVYGLYLCAVPVERHRLYESYDKHRPQLRMRLAIAINRRKDMIYPVCLRWEATHRHGLIIVRQKKSISWVVARSPNCKVQEKKVDPNWVHVCTSLHGGMLWPLDDSFSMQKLTCLIRRYDKS